MWTRNEGRGVYYGSKVQMLYSVQQEYIPFSQWDGLGAELKSYFKRLEKWFSSWVHCVLPEDMGLVPCTEGQLTITSAEFWEVWCPLLVSTAL